MPDDTRRLLMEAYNMGHRQMSFLDTHMDDHFVISLPGVSRIRVCAYKQRNSYAMTARMIPFQLPKPEEIGLPQAVLELTDLQEGMVLLCGPSSSGKSITMACLIDRINHTRHCHILTLERPIEHLYRNDKAFLSQRELNIDTMDFGNALQAARLISPDVLMLSEISDRTIFQELCNMADNNHMVLSTVRARSVKAVIMNLLQQFPQEERRNQALALAHVLRAVVCQQLVPTSQGIIPVFDVIHIGPLLQQAIMRERYDVFDRYYQKHRQEQDLYMTDRLYQLYREGLLSRIDAEFYASEPDQVRALIEKR